MRTLTIAVSGMHCAACGLLIDDTLLDLDGVFAARTDLASGRCVVTVDDSVTEAAIVGAISATGYTCTLV